MSRRPGFITVLKDIASYTGGWAIILKQAGILFAPPSQVNAVLVAVGVVLIGVPGLSQLALAWFGRLTSTGAPPPPPPSAGSPSPSSSGVPS